MADRIVKPDLPHTLSTTEQRIFDNFYVLGKMFAENSAAQAQSNPTQPDPQKQASSSQPPPVGLTSTPEPSSPRRRYEIRPTEPHPPRTLIPDDFSSFATTPLKRKLDLRDLLPGGLSGPLGIPLGTPEYSWSGTFEQFHKDTANTSQNMEDHRKKVADKVKELADKYKKDMKDMYKEIADSTPGSSAAANSGTPPLFPRPLPRPTALASPRTLFPTYRSMAGPSSLRTESSPLKTNLMRPAGVSKRGSKGKNPVRPSVEIEDVEDDEDRMRLLEKIGLPIDSISLDMGTFP
ncbi:hypothetical protein GGR55DRAFT_703247 [Xylaria sp. FL0064]|nr:hypothetical protein GGR55DRAFT_703247 [Xylaria sp. FL0064]